MIETEGTHTAGITESEFRKQIEAQTPLGRIGRVPPVIGMFAGLVFLIGSGLAAAVFTDKLLGR